MKSYFVGLITAYMLGALENNSLDPTLWSGESKWIMSFIFLSIWLMPIMIKYLHGGYNFNKEK